MPFVVCVRERYSLEDLHTPALTIVPIVEDVTGGVIRALIPDDIPWVVDLRRIAFHQSERPGREALSAYFRSMFLQSPWKDPSLPSLVYENRDGVITGFLGVIPRRMSLGGNTIRVAVATQLMVAPGAQGLTGRRLARAYLEGEQDLSLSDTANEAARRLWGSVGGHVSLLQSLSWMRRLRPGRYALTRIRSTALQRAAAIAAAPLTSAVDGMSARANALSVPPAGGSTLDALSPDLVSRYVGPVLGGFALRPSYEDGSLPWLLARAAEKRQFGPLRSGFVRSARGDALGWYLYHLGASGFGQVVQIAARPTATAEVMRWMFHDAWRQGAVTLAGRVEPWLMSALGETDCTLAREGPWMLLHSRRKELIDMIEHGAGFVSRLDGEWWLSF